MKKLRLFVCFLVLFTFAVASHAITYVVPTDRTMAHIADAVVVASALNSFCQVNEAGAIETVTTFSIEDVVGGGVESTEIAVHEPGGVLGDQARVMPGVPQFTPGQRVILMLSRTPQQHWAVTDIGLGKFSIVNDRLGREIALRDDGEVVGWDIDGSTHFEKPRLAKPFIEFLRTEMHGGLGRDDYFVERAPLSAIADSTGSSKLKAAPTSFLGLSYTYSGSGRWNIFPTAVSFRSENTLPSAPGNGITAITTGLGRWSSAASTNINYAYFGAEPGTHMNGVLGAPDGVNTVIFEVDLSSIGAPAYDCAHGGVLGYGGVTNVSGTHPFNGETFSTATEGDVAINKGLAACSPTGFPFAGGDFNTAVTHELGHTLGLRHSDQTRAMDPSTPCTSDPTLDCSTQAIMKAVIVNGINAVLQPWDLRGVQALYPGACTNVSLPAPQATPATVSSGQPSTLSIAPSGTGPFTYQWYVGNPPSVASPVASSNSASIQVSPTTTTNYWVLVSNSCPSSQNSVAVTVTVTQPTCTNVSLPTAPQASPSTISAGQPSTLSITPSGTGPFTYQWYVGTPPSTASPIASSNSASIQVAPSATTTYWVLVSNGCPSSQNSTAVTVTVTQPTCTAPSITADVQDQQVTSGGSTTLTLGYSGTAGTITWYQGTKPDKSHQAGTGSPFQTAGLTQNTQFWGEVVNSCGSAQSRTATISVAANCVAPAISLVDVSSHSTNGTTSVNLIVQATGTALQYQWYRGQQHDTSNPLPNGTTALATDTPAVTTTYWVRVSNSCGSVDSTAVTVTVSIGNTCPTVSIGSLSLDTVISSNTPVFLNVSASGGSTFHYAWFQGVAGDTTHPVGTDSPRFQSANLFTTTSFWVKVTNDCSNSTNSRTVTVTVIPAKHRATKH